MLVLAAVGVPLCFPYMKPSHKKNRGKPGTNAKSLNRPLRLMNPRPYAATHTRVTGGHIDAPPPNSRGLGVVNCVPACGCRCGSALVGPHVFIAGSGTTASWTAAWGFSGCDPTWGSRGRDPVCSCKPVPLGACSAGSQAGAGGDDGASLDDDDSSLARTSPCRSLGTPRCSS